MPLPEKVAFILMFGIGTQEMVVIGLLFLVIFGPNKLPGMARDLGRFVSRAHQHVDEFKSELTSTTDLPSAEEGDQNTRHTGLAIHVQHAQSASRSGETRS